MSDMVFGAHATGGRVICLSYQCQTGWCNTKTIRTIMLTEAQDMQGHGTGFFHRPDLICGECGYSPRIMTNAMDTNMEAN
jgi:hypothetical protein